MTAMRLRFTIRELLWLTLVVALAAGWWIDHKRLTPLVVRRDIFAGVNCGGIQKVTLDSDVSKDR